MCNDIGEAAYVDSLVAAALLDAAAGLPTGAAIRRRLGARYGVPWAPSLSSAPVFVNSQSVMVWLEGSPTAPGTRAQQLPGSQVRYSMHARRLACVPRLVL